MSKEFRRILGDFGTQSHAANTVNISDVAARIAKCSLNTLARSLSLVFSDLTGR